MFHDGIRHTTRLSFGAATILVGVVLVAATALAGIKHGPGTLTNMVAIGVFVDVLLATGVGRELHASALVLRVAAALAGVALVALGTALYVGAGLGAGPRDSLMLVIADRTRLDIGVVRALIEVGVLAVGIALGGAFGIGTILFALGAGPAVGLAFRLLRVTTQVSGTQAHDGLARGGAGDLLRHRRTPADQGGACDERPAGAHHPDLGGATRPRDGAQATHASWPSPAKPAATLRDHLRLQRKGRQMMPWVYRRYCQTAAVIFLLITVYTVPTKLAQGRLADDWLHSVLHLCSGLVGIYAGWVATGPAPAQGFTSVVGVLYFALGCYGWFRPGLLLGTPFAIPLGVAENVFHFALSLPALAILLLHWARWPSRWPRGDRRRQSRVR